MLVMSEARQREEWTRQSILTFHISKMLGDKESTPATFNPFEQSGEPETVSMSEVREMMKWHKAASA